MSTTAGSVCFRQANLEVPFMAATARAGVKQHSLALLHETMLHVASMKPLHLLY